MSSLPDTIPVDEVTASPDTSGVVLDFGREASLEKPPLFSDALGITNLAKDKFNSIRWDLLPPSVTENVDVDKINAVLDTGAALFDAKKVNPLLGNHVEISKHNRSSNLASTGALYDMYKRFTIDRPIDYVSGAPEDMRLALQRADTDLEKTKILEERFGPGVVSFDKQGRILYKNPETGLETSVNDVDILSFGDARAAVDELPVLVSTLAAAYITGGMSLKYQFAADVLALMGGFALRESMDSLMGENSEELNQIADRLAVETGSNAVMFGVGAGVVKFGEFLKNPLHAGVTKEKLITANAIRELNSARRARGAEQLNVRLSMLNDIPGIARAEGILSKMPWSAGGIQKNVKKTEELLKDEIDYLLSGFDDIAPETKIALERSIRKKLLDLRNAQFESMRLANNARFTGVDPITGSRTLLDGVKVALDRFKSEAPVRMSLVHQLAGNDPFINLTNFKNLARKFQDNIPVDDFGAPVDFFNPGNKAANLDSVLRLKDANNFSEAHRIRMALGAMLRGDAPIENISKGELKQLYKALNEDIERDALRLSRLNLNAPAVWNRQRFLREFRDFNAWYKEGHDVFNEKGGSMFEIIKQAKKNPTQLVENFLRKGNRDHWKTIEQQLDPVTMDQVRLSAREFILTKNKTGSDLLEKMDSLGQDTMRILLKDSSDPSGARNYSLWRKLGSQSQKFEAAAISKYATEHDTAMSVFSSNFGEGSIGRKAALQVRSALGENSREWKQIQLAHASNIVRESMDSSGNIKGSLLLKEFSGKHKDINNIIFRGSELGTNLQLVGEIASASQKAETSAAGGIAAGMAFLEILQGNFVTAGITGAFSWSAAKILTSKTFKKWATNKQISSNHKAIARWMIQEMNRFSTGMDNTEHFSSE